MRLVNLRPNFNRVDSGKVSVWFSYETPIAFTNSRGETVIRKNVWGSTTGKHLNAVCSDKSVRIDGESFENRLANFVF